MYVCVCAIVCMCDCVCVCMHNMYVCVCVCAYECVRVSDLFIATNAISMHIFSFYW